MTAGSAELLDPQALADLRALDPDGSQGLLRRLGEAWARSLERLLPELDRAAAGPDLDAIRRIAHTLKSSTANLAALHLSAQWQTIEQQCKEGRAEGLAGQLAQARAGTLRVREALRAVE
ncbi:Hpt domain-containing protein [Inhella proteolytica]|uniref:Hpt domain-containing protein n=1 Tax=Inhella proteolytica TaxID=2795029 RepID=A0A931NCR4_9BURK|nr:Hpt domain-containing protein [Inhella proteolytica]MBH9575852.1 Hpt domain-containing protein [Inhella proteolytica]